MFHGWNKTLSDAAPETMLLTVFLRHDQSNNLDAVQTKLKDAEWWDRFPPAGVEIVSWTVAMGFGQIVTLRLPASKLAEVNVELERSAWGVFRTEVLSGLRLHSGARAHQGTRAQRRQVMAAATGLSQSAPGARPRAGRLPEPAGRCDRAGLCRRRSRHRRPGGEPQRGGRAGAERPAVERGAVPARDEAAGRVRGGDDDRGDQPVDQHAARQGRA